MSQAIQEKSKRNQAPQREQFITLSTVISMLSLVVSSGVAWWAFTNNPLGTGLESYDFSNPKASLASHSQIVADHNYRAVLDIMFAQNARRASEKLKTLKIHKESEFRGSKILFISFDENGIKKHATESFEKDAESGAWRINGNAGVAMTSAEQNGNATAEELKLSKMSKKWEAGGVLE